jgi:hypothetical protein
MQDPRVDTRTILEIAATSDTDPRSVQRELAAQRGERPHVRGRPGERIRAVLATKGLIQPHRAA